MSRKFYYPVRNTDNPYSVQLVSVSEKIYRSIIPEIERTRKQMQRSGRCVCPKSKLWACDGDCAICPYSACGNTVSLDAPLDDTDSLTLGDTLISDNPSPEDVALNKALLAALYDELERIDPDGRRICELVASNCTEREAASILGISKTAYRYRWMKLREKLAEKLQSYI